MTRQARKILEATREIDGVTVAVFPGYRSFSFEAPPSWWGERQADPAWGEITGVHEDQAGAENGSFIVTEHGLVHFGDRGQVWVPYDKITGWDPLTKEPPADTLTLRMQGGGSQALRFSRGGAFAFVQFLIPVLKRGARGDG